jgi:hypothetical protein
MLGVKIGIGFCFRFEDRLSGGGLRFGGGLGLGLQFSTGDAPRRDFPLGLPLGFAFGFTLSFTGGEEKSAVSHHLVTRPLIFWS